MEIGEVLRDGLGPYLTDVVGAEVERVKIGELLGDGPGTSDADSIRPKVEPV